MSPCTCNRMSTRAHQHHCEVMFLPSVLREKAAIPDQKSSKRYSCLMVLSHLLCCSNLSVGSTKSRTLTASVQNMVDRIVQGSPGTLLLFWKDSTGCRWNTVWIVRCCHWLTSVWKSQPLKYMTEIIPRCKILPTPQPNHDCTSQVSMRMLVSKLSRTMHLNFRTPFHSHWESQTLQPAFARV